MPVGESTLEDLLVDRLSPHYNTSLTRTTPVGNPIVPIIEEDMCSYLELCYPHFTPEERKDILKNIWCRENTIVHHTQRENSTIKRSRDFYRSFVLGEGDINIRNANQPRQPQKVKVSLVNFSNPKNNQWRLTRQTSFGNPDKRIRTDLIIWLNGLPLVVIELKHSAHELAAAQDQLDGYIASVPDLGVSNLFLVASNATEVCYGPIDTIHTGWQLRSSASLTEHLCRLETILNPDHLLHMLETFVLYDRRGNQLIKLLPRHHQVPAVDAIVDRIKGPENKGLIKHHQGSGKTLLMLYATRAIRQYWKNHGIVHNKVLLLVDRRDLLEQLTKQFAACRDAGIGESYEPHPAIPALYKVESGRELTLALGQRKDHVIAATMQSARNFADGEAIDSSDVLVLCDEAHRTQAGSLGQKIRELLPNATYIGFTGTPIAGEERDTYKQFSDKQDNGHILHGYSMEDAIGDGVVVPIRVVNRRPYIEYLNEDAVDAVASDAASLKSVNAQLSSRNLLNEVIPDALRHYRSSVSPWKAIFVAGNRYGCVQMYQAFRDAGVQPGEIAISFSPRSTKNNSQDIEDETGDVEDETGDDEAREQIEEVEAFYNDKLKGKEDQMVEGFVKIQNTHRKFLIVTSKRLTGFDAPVAGCLYLIKNMAQHHTLFQAITRVNRATFIMQDTEALHKKEGIVINYALPMESFKAAVDAIEGERSGTYPGHSQEDLNAFWDQASLLLEDENPAISSVRTLLAKITRLLAAGNRLEGENKAVYRQLVELAAQHDPKKRRIAEVSEYIAGQISQHVYWAIKEGEEIVLGAAPSSLQIDRLDEHINSLRPLGELQKTIDTMGNGPLKQQTFGQWLLHLQELILNEKQNMETLNINVANLKMVNTFEDIPDEDTFDEEKEEEDRDRIYPTPETSTEKVARSEYEANLARARAAIQDLPRELSPWVAHYHATMSFHRVVGLWGWALPSQVVLGGRQEGERYNILYGDLVNVVILPFGQGSDTPPPETPFLVTDGIVFRLHDGEKEHRLTLDDERLMDSPLAFDRTLSNIERIKELNAAPSLIELLSRDQHCYAASVLSLGAPAFWAIASEAFLDLHTAALWSFITEERLQNFCKVVNCTPSEAREAQEKAAQVYPRELSQLLYASRLVASLEEDEWVISEVVNGKSLKEIAREVSIENLPAWISDTAKINVDGVETGNGKNPESPIILSETQTREHSELGYKDETTILPNASLDVIADAKATAKKRKKSFAKIMQARGFHQSDDGNWDRTNG